MSVEYIFSIAGVFTVAQIYMCVCAIICIHTLSFQTLQLCRVQPKTLGLAMVMLNT